MPIVWKKKKDAKIVIAGSSPKKEIISMQSENVIVTGWVKDMKEYYSKSKIFIAPMQIGTGLQNKLLEAMAMGLPCITTSLANKALMAQKDQDILIANTKQEMAESIFTLLENKNIYSTLSINGKQYVRNNFSWEFSTNKLSLIFQQLTKA
jgi:glycosyltransferase involved in cell wall biosynthesis